MRPVTLLADRRPSPAAHLEPTPPRFRHKRALIGAAILLGVATLLWLVVAGTGTGHHSTGTTAPAASPLPRLAVPASPPPAALTATTCDLPAGDQAIPTTIPPDITWLPYEDMLLPFSSSAGPEFVLADGVARCFARNPLGALVADTQIQFRDVAATDWKHVIASQVVPGPGATILAADRAKLTASEAASQPGDYCQYAGTAWLSYTPAKAVIELVTRCGSILQALVTTVVWDGRDWKLVLQPAGGVAPAAVRLDNLTGFVPFGGI